ncbi:MAG TPA: GMC oxidoreductase [Kofleriaceae bacterium]|nr:GMC oxidoreductase [Kofleriaceae bacterium]
MFDVAVVGAGSAGCVLAHRLSAEPARTVCLIEAGPAKHRAFKVRAPGMYQTLWRTPLDWAFSTEPQAQCDGRRHFWPRGKLLGGTSCLNAMVYIRGHRANYDGWGVPGWRYDELLPYFVRSEDNVRGASAFHGAGGPLAVDDVVPSGAARAFVAATAARCKVRITDDFNGEDQEGAGHYQVTLRRGLRASTATAFLDPIRDRANLTVITGGLATALVIDGDRVTGVRYRAGGTEHVIEAKQVVVACGAIGSPQLLLLSGIGPGDELRAAGVEPRHELPAVGKHLADHLLAAVVHDVAGDGARRASVPRVLGWIARHLVSGGGPMAAAPVDAGAFVRSRPDAALPDVQFHFTPWRVVLPTDDEAGPPSGRSASILPGLIYPRSLGEVRLRSADPTAPPAIDPRYFSDPADLDHLVAGVKLAREIAATAPLAEQLGAELFPGRDVSSDDAIRASVRATCNTIFHPVGTCRMGEGGDAVVDPALRVRGLRGLRVADASIMPRIVGGNTNAPTIMIAEKAADLIAAG